MFTSGLCCGQTGIHPCMLSRRACRASIWFFWGEGRGGWRGSRRGIGVVNRLACFVLLVIVRDACVIKRDNLTSRL